MSNSKGKIAAGTATVQPPPPTPQARPLDNGEKAAFEARCAVARAYLCEAMLAAPTGPEKTRAKDAYVAFVEVALTAKAGRGWEPNLLDMMVGMQEEIDTLRAMTTRRIMLDGAAKDQPGTPAQSEAKRHEVDLGPLNEAPPPAEGRRRPRPGRA